MVDIGQLETGFAAWRRENAQKENSALETAKIIANFANTNELHAIMGINSSHLKIFNAFNASLLGSITYMKLAIDEHVAQTYQEAPLSANEQSELAAINAHLTTIYNKVIIISHPDISSWRIPIEALAINRELEQLHNRIVFWIDNHALQSINLPSSKALCLSIYTVLKIVRIRLDNLNISPKLLSLVKSIIGIDSKKVRIDDLLAQIAEKIAAFPAPPAPILIDAIIGSADQMVEDKLEQVEEEDDEEAAAIRDAEAIERERQRDLAFLALPADEDEDEFLECINDSATPPEIIAPPERDAPPEAEEVAEAAEPLLEVFFDPENQPTPAPTLSSHFDAEILDILAEEHPLLEKISHITAALERVNTGLTELIRQKNKANTLQTHVQNANEIIRAVNRDSAALNALDLVNTNRLNISALIEQSPELEQEAWHRRILQLETPTPVIPARLVGTTQTVVSLVTNMYRTVVPTRAQQMVNGLIPTSADEQCKEELKTLAKNRIRAINGHFNAAGQQLVIGELDTLENEMGLTINALAGETHPIKALLKHATITELEALCTANRKVHDLMSAYEGVINHITATRDRLNSIKGLDATIDNFILNYDSFLVAVSLFLSHYLGSIFKTDAADKIDKARTMKKEVETWQTDCQTELSKDIDTISRNPDISATVKTAFLNKIAALLDQVTPSELATTPLNADTIIEDTTVEPPAGEAPNQAAALPDEGLIAPNLVVDAEATDTPAAPNVVAVSSLQKPIITAFDTVQTLFNRLAPPPVTPPPRAVVETPAQRVIVI